MDFESLTKSSGEWLRGTGPESDIVVSSRIRLARNVTHFPFLSRADSKIRTELANYLQEKLDALQPVDDIEYVDVELLDTLDRQFLVERQLISREHAEMHGSHGVGIGSRENISVMINEEDHLRIQVLRSGLSLDECWKEIDLADNLLEEQIRYAYDDQFGYLTACPTNAGTGIRVSVMLHLPALVMTKEITKVFQGLQKINLAVRGLYGEGSQAMGDFYQVSNQITLGKSEQEMIDSLLEVVPGIIEGERTVRKSLLEQKHDQIHDQISRAYGILRSAQSISSEETMHLLSSVRMGISLGLIDDIEIPTINELFIHTQPAHLQKIRAQQLDSGERNIARATYLRERLA